MKIATILEISNVISIQYNAPSKTKKQNKDTWLQWFYQWNKTH